jgi:hypothetical protein
MAALAAADDGSGGAALVCGAGRVVADLVAGAVAAGDAGAVAGDAGADDLVVGAVAAGDAGAVALAAAGLAGEVGDGSTAVAGGAIPGPANSAAASNTAPNRRPL